MEEALEAEERSNGERAGQGRDGAHGCAADGRLLPAFCTTADLVWWHGAANTCQPSSRSGRGQSPQWPQWLLWPPILHVCKCKCSLWMRRMRSEPGVSGQERRAGCSVPRGAARGQPRLTDTHTTRRAIRFGVGIGARARKRAWLKPLLSTDGGWTDRHRPPWLQQSLNTGTTATCSSLSMLRFANADSPAKQS